MEFIKIYSISNHRDNIADIKTSQMNYSNTIVYLYCYLDIYSNIRISIRLYKKYEQYIILYTYILFLNNIKINVIQKITIDYKIYFFYWHLIKSPYWIEKTSKWDFKLWYWINIFTSTIIIILFIIHICMF